MGEISDGAFSGLKIKRNEPMKNHTTFGVGGICDYYFEPETLVELRRAIEFSDEYGLQLKIIGNGSNLLVSDAGYRGIILSTKRLKSITLNGKWVRVLCGATLNNLVSFLESNSLFGYENLYGIPGTVGGAVIQNASAFNRKVSDNLGFIEVLKDGKIVSVCKKDCGFRYRNSNLKLNNKTIVAVYFDICKFEKAPTDSKESFLLKRKSLQPQGRSCGSVFVNPEGEFVGALISKCNLKGYKIGGARVSDIHANFIINESNAKASDIYSLIKYIKEKVFDEFGITLKEEVELVGEF